MPASRIFLTVETNTKREEKTILGGFLQRLQYSPNSITQREQPDFELGLNSKLIGVEVTKYFSDYSKHGSKTQRGISEWVAFAKKLKDKLCSIRIDLTYLYGSIYFHNDSTNYAELLRDKSWTELSRLVESISLKHEEETTVEVSSENFPILAKYIKSIYFKNTYPNGIYLWWEAGLQSGKVINNESALKLIVGKKQTASAQYRQDYFQKWLLIYAGGIGLHDIFSISSQEQYRQGRVTLTRLDNAMNSNFNSEIDASYFTHIFVWDKFKEVIFQIYPYEKKIFDYGEKSIWINHLPIKE